MRYSYQTSNTCSTKIAFDLDGDVVHNVEFTGGCSGNLSAIQKLVDGFTVDRLVSELGGLKCGRRPTSCVDQLATAVKMAYSKPKQAE
ncbi:MAG: TIGR03905 family TSCPD domain-containing protein [Clostridiales bacterium]|nr:TIGR03905 family TSCPD domain-containing protein [Clostridiales bacterium]